MSCPICENETVPTYRPFCSKRCADLDLGRWLNGSYALEGPVSEDTEDQTGGSMSDDPADR
ncbi:MAG: DNA gyrase inhibitor YacG [Pseudomonadota bacterium]